MRTREELEGIILGLQAAKATPGMQLWFKELGNLEREILQSSYMAKGEEAVRALGVLQGIGMCLQIDDVLKVKSNLGNKGILKP